MKLLLTLVLVLRTSELLASQRKSIDWNIKWDIDWQKQKNTSMTYELYTFHPGVNYPVSLTSLDTDRIQDRCRHIVIIAHGVSGDDGDELDYRPFIMAYLLDGDHYVLVVKWKSDLADALQNVKYYSRGLAFDIYMNLISRNFDPNHMTLVGFSLGAHLVGVTGKILLGRIGRVVGLDPTGPGFRGLRRWIHLNSRISRESGRIVEIVHTSHTLGLWDDLGHVDFYLNSEFNQPGCNTSIKCNHGRAIMYYVEALLSPKAFEGLRCESYTSFYLNWCEGGHTEYIAAEYFQFSCNNGTPEYTVSEPKPGSYYLQTNKRLPFGRWKRGTVPSRKNFWDTPMLGKIKGEVAQFVVDRFTDLQTLLFKRLG